MVQSAADLRQLKGVGSILAKRLYDAGFDSFEKIADAGEDGLRKVRGISARGLATMVEQARELARKPEPGGPDSGAAVKERLAEVRRKIQGVAQSARDRFQQDLTGRRGKKLSSDLVRIEDALVRVEGAGRKRSKRAGKALVKAEKRIAGLDEASLKKVRKAVRRIRKGLQKALQ